MSLQRTSGQTADARRMGGEAKPKSARTAARLAWSISVLAATFGGLFLVLLALNSRNPEVSTYEYWGANAVTSIVFPAVGALIVSRHPRHALGWLFCIVGLSSGLEGFASEYATYALVVEPDSLPGAGAAAWLGSWIGTPGFVSVVLTPLLFPDGRPPSRRWWPLVWLAAGVIVAATVSIALMPGPLERHPSVKNPFGIEGTQGANESLFFAAGPILGFTLLAGIASLVIRYRRSRGVERQQLKWFTYAAALAPFGLVGNTLFPDLAWLIGGVSVSLIPLAIGIAILRYRLYDIDIIINRTLVYGALTAGVVGLYVLVVGGAGALLHVQRNLLLSILAAGIVAVLFAPLRDRLQRGVNRLMYGERDDPYAVLSRLGRRLETSLAPEAVLPAIVESIARALRLPQVEIWLANGETLRLRAVHGKAPPEAVVQDASAVKKLRRAPDGLGPADLGPAAGYGGVLDERGIALVLPLTHGGELVGALCLAPRGPGEGFSEADRRLLRDLATQTGAAAHAVRLTVALRSSLEDLRRSRERLVAAQDEERRRIQRDLHDGLGPILASMRLRLEACLDAAQETGDPLAGDLERLYELVGQATADIRRLVYDLRPPVLDQLGLVPALRQHCERFGRESGIGVRFEAEEGLSVPAAVEAALLRVAQEALVNVGKHAHASRADVRLARSDGWLELEVQDDGAGFGTNGQLPEGTGIGSMRERAELLGGRLLLSSSPGTGTRVAVRIPVEGTMR